VSVPEVGSDLVRVLVVSHVEDDVRLARDALTSAGAMDVRLETAGTIASAVERLDDSSIDFVLVDIELLDEQGQDALGKMQEVAPDVPVVAMTWGEEASGSATSAVPCVRDFISRNHLDGRLLAPLLHYARDHARLRSRLERAELEKKALFEHIGSAAVVVGADTLIRQVNKRFEALLGVSEKDVVGKRRFLELVSASDLARVKDVFSQTRDTERPSKTLAHFVSSSGRVFVARVTAVALPENGQMVVSVKDVTARRQEEEEHRYQRQYFKSLFENSPEGIVSFDTYGRVLDANPSFEKMFGYASSELKGRPLLDFILPSRLESEGRETMRRTFLGSSYVPRTKRRHADGTELTVTILGASIVLDGEMVGGFGIYRDMTGYFEARERLEESFVDLVETTSRAMESIDPYTAGHQRRVGRLADLVGRKLGLDDDRLQGLYVGSLLHDIGKLSIPSTLLTKPTALSKYEWNLIRSHPRRGYEILVGANLPWPVAEMALKHHERQDGSGYPQGEDGSSLSLEVRILAVCDVVEAMSSDRPYRPARSPEAVLDEVKSGSGLKYDADVAKACLEVLQDGSFLLSDDDHLGPAVDLG